MKMAIVASLLLASAHAASAQYATPRLKPLSAHFQYIQYQDTAAAEKDLADEKKARDKAGKERELTGKSDQGARRRLEEECTRALERGVDDGVRRSYGCRD